MVVDPVLPATIHSDRERLQQVLRNFLSNALKFTEQGVVTLRAEPVTEGVINHLVTFNTLRDELRSRPGDYIVFSVEDSGIGIPQEKQRMISEVIHVEEKFRGRTILLVDDDIRNTFALSAVLRRRGLEVITAADGEQALEQLDEHADLIDIVLMDIMMPVMDGYEAMRKIREQSRFERLPLIALTAKALKEDRERCIAAGASDYMTKPIDHDQLFSLIRVWITTLEQ